jgi:hypothetical protein
LPELPSSAVLATSGFDVFRREEYYIARSYVQVPPQWIQMIFPYLNLWRFQVNEQLGFDKGAAAKNFVNLLLPFLAEIVIQDGIYFQKSYPNHTFSEILMHKLQAVNYEEWASNARDQVKDREVIMEQNITKDRKYEAILRTTEQLVMKINNLEQRIDGLSDNIREIKEAIMQNINILHREVQLSPELHGTRTNAITPIDMQASLFRSTTDLSPIPIGAVTPIVITPMHVTADRCNERIVPIIPSSLHKTITENMDYWMEHKFWLFLDRNEQSLKSLGWSSTLQHRFTKRKDIAMWVKYVSEEFHEKTINWESDIDIIKQVAERMDDERGDMTVTNAIQQFKQNRTLLKKRRKKKK